MTNPMYIFQDDESLRNLFLGIAVKCPFDRPLGTCPANNFRKKDLRNTFSQVEKVDMADINSMLELHYQCMAEREKEVFQTLGKKCSPD
ncbi:MAG: hypothetical protein KKA07_09420 [Bacteroidetes bacterium]|nr:hypothetical protein [Bacteroidota bacterium]MBU1719280.1 hypothetical protein [Bacteroidota bacterium]